MAVKPGKFRKLQVLTKITNVMNESRIVAGIDVHKDTIFFFVY